MFSSNKRPIFPKAVLSMALVCVFFGTNYPLQAQLKWTLVDSLYAPLPPSVHIYRTNDHLNGRPFKAYYVSADLSDRKITFSTDTCRATPGVYYSKKRQPLLLVNGGFFDPRNFRSLSLVIRNGRILGYNITSLKSLQSNYYYYPTRSAIGITGKRKADVAWLFTDTTRRWPYAFQENPIVARGKQPYPILADLNTLDNWKPWRMRTAIGGGPVLVQNGVVRITNQEEQIFLGGELEINPRTAMGYTKDNRLIILVIEGRNSGVADGATLTETAALMDSLACLEALNLDGGASSYLMVNGKETIKPSDISGPRAVGSVFLIERKQR